MTLPKLFCFMNFSSCPFKKRITRVWVLAAGIKIFGPQKKGFHLGCRNLRRPRRDWFWGKIKSFSKMLLNIGNAQLKVFCTAFIVYVVIVKTHPINSIQLHAISVKVRHSSHCKPSPAQPTPPQTLLRVLVIGR